jgi:hypothetical protein
MVGAKMLLNEGGWTYVEALCWADAGVAEVGAEAGAGEAEEEVGLAGEACVT